MQRTSAFKPVHNDTSRSVLITGCSSGIGLAAATLFATRGWRVCATVRDSNTNSARILDAHPLINVIELDVTDTQAVTATVDAAAAALGGLDAVVSNAGTALLGPLELTRAPQLRHLFDTNVVGALAVVGAALPHLRSKAAGVAVAVSSALGSAPLPLSAAYAASKAALDAALSCAAAELCALGVAVKLVVPGRVRGTSFLASAAHAGEGAGETVYEGMMGRAMEALQKDGEASCSEPVDVAEAVWDACTDGEDRLRYVVGEDAQLLLAMRKEMDDVQFRDEMIKRFHLN